MKHNILTFLISSVLLFASCESFLDEQPRGKTVAETLEHYNGLFHDYAFSICNYTDWCNPFMKLTPTAVKNFPQTILYSNFDYTSAERAYKYETEIFLPSENCIAWELIYQFIYRYNLVIAGVMDAKDGSEAEKKALYAEARMSRAWMHFILAQMFSKPYSESYADTELTIPIVTKASTSVKEYQRATMRDLYNFITKEMEEALPDLEDRKDHNMRIYKTTGYAIFGKYLWSIGNYQKALPILQTAYTRSKNETFIIQNYNTLQAKYNYKEIDLYTLYKKECATTNTAMLCYGYTHPEYLLSKQCTELSMCLSRASSTGCLAHYIDPRLYDMYGEYDLRRNFHPTIDPNGNPYEYPVGFSRDMRHNYGVELADIYLGLAECEARVGSQENAKNILKEFRSYRVLTGHEDVPASVTTKDDLIKFCIEEQFREYSVKPQCFYTIRRIWNDPTLQSLKPFTHTLGDETYTMKEENLYLKLPETILQWNPNWR